MTTEHRRREVTVPARATGRRGVLHLPARPPDGLIVFVHGSGPGSADGFADYAGQLCRLGVASLVVDKVTDGYTARRRNYDLLAADACDALFWVQGRADLAGLPVALLGYSEGSWVAAKAAARHPELIDLLVLCAAPLAPPRSQTAYEWANANQHRPRMVRVIGQAFVHVVMAMLTDYGNEDAARALPAIPIPVMLVLGADDPKIDVARAVSILSRTRSGSPTVIVPGAGHSLPPDGEWIRAIATELVGVHGD